MTDNNLTRKVISQPTNMILAKGRWLPKSDGSESIINKRSVLNSIDLLDKDDFAFAS